MQDVTTVQHKIGYEKFLKTTQHKDCNKASLAIVKGETGHKEMCAEKLNGVVGMRFMLPLCSAFTAIVSELTGCGTRSSAIAEGPRDAPCQLKPC